MHSLEQDPARLTTAEDARSRLGLIDGLATYRRALGLSQRKVARRMGTQQSAVCDIEQGLTDTRLGTLQRYARALGVTLLIRLIPEPHDDIWSAWAQQALVENQLNYTEETWTYSTPIEETIITELELDFWLEELTSRPYELAH